MNRNARLGLVFFFVYAAVYAGFVAVCTFRYEWMGTIVVAGLNLAIVYGIGLIALAMLMAVAYLLLCTPAGDEPPDANRPPAPSPGTAGRGLG